MRRSMNEVEGPGCCNGDRLMTSEDQRLQLITELLTGHRTIVLRASRDEQPQNIPPGLGRLATFANLLDHQVPQPSFGPLKSTPWSQATKLAAKGGHEANQRSEAAYE